VQSILRTALIAVLFVGAVIGTAKAATTATPHKVVRGETLQSVAQRAHLSVAEVAALPEPAMGALSPSVQQDLRDLEAASDAASAAELKLWLGESRQKQPGTIRRFARGIINRTSTIAASLTRSAMRFIGTPYVFGGTTPSGFDCSGYTQYLFAKLGVRLPRTADAQYYAGNRPTNGIAAGDLVFFQTYEPGPSHVGIYIGDGRFIHSSSHGVMISRLGDSYWASRYLGAKRFRMN